MVCETFEFGFALGATQDLAFFDFVFVDIDFGGTFRTTDHGLHLRTVVRKVGVQGPCPPLCSVLYTRCMKSTPVRGGAASNGHRTMRRRTFRMTPSREYPNGQWLVSEA